MQASHDHDCDHETVDLTCIQNLRHAPHPISADPRLEPNCPGYEHERIVKNLHVLTARIPHLEPGMPSTNGGYECEDARMKCCCGRHDCAYLEHNNAALGGLEKDLETAARLGQALLSRHESYISESQAEQARLSTCISELEKDRLTLQTTNEKIVAENRELLQQLEYLNGSLVDSDEDVKRLEQLLSDCELELKRLNGLVRRTEELDGRVQEMERERHLLNQQMEEGHEESRSTLARWRESERKVRELEEDVRRIEWEARLDREKHEEIISRLEKERALERELSGAEGRLKGAAAVNNIDKSGRGSKSVVSHFVRDILKDNASLQAGIAELRQLLQCSNEEVQNLREQIMLHQPIAEGEEGDIEPRKSVSLEQELQSDEAPPKQLQQEVHVHHHYHAKLPKSRITAIRRPSKRRAIMPGFGNGSDSSAPSTPISRPQRYSSSPVVPLSLHNSQPHKSNRWSMQSSATMSSLLSSIPSSPRSYFDRSGSIFDRLEQGEESSRPTSPESVGDLLSPGPGQWRFRKDKANPSAYEEEDDQKGTFEMSPVIESKACFDANETPKPSDTPAVASTPEVRSTPEPHSLLEDDKEVTPKPSIVLRPPTADVKNSTDCVKELRPPEQIQRSISETQSVRRKTSEITLDRIPEIRPTLNRKGSHETLVSISGMDIHIPQRASPTTTLELLHSHFAHRPTQARKISAAQPLASVTEYTAVSTPSSVHQRDIDKATRDMPSSIDALSGIAIPRPNPFRTPSQVGAIGRLGGWVRERWGITPTKSSSSLRTVSSGQESIPTVSSTATRLPDNQESTNVDSGSDTVSMTESTSATSVPDSNQSDPTDVKVNLANLFAGRPPGVNQPGFIPGFRAAMMSRRTPSQVMAPLIDEEGLREGLAE